MKGDLCMPTTHRGVTAASLLAAILTILAALVAVPNTASAQGTSDPMFGAPTVGECKDYTVEEGAGKTETSEPVDCATSHTAKVIAVELLPESLTWESPMADIVRFTAKQCVLASHEVLGRTDKLRSMSAYTTFLFWPTSGQKENGARWVRCDINLVGGGQLKPLPVDTIPMLPAAPLPDQVAACRAGENLYLTACQSGHRFRAMGGVTLADGPYPGRKKFIKVAVNRCDDIAGRNWHAFWSSKFEWKLGERTLVCYKKTSN